MGSVVENSRRLNIQEYAERLPESDMLAKLGESALGGGRPYEDWWDDLRTEYAAGILPVDATVAAYYSVMHPVDVDTFDISEEQGPENARRLKFGEKVVGLRGYDREFDVNCHGVLAADVVALLGHPSNPMNVDFASVQLGLHFTDRKDTKRAYPAADLLIGEQEIVAEYRGQLPIFRKQQKRYGGDGEFIRTTGIMAKLGLLDGEPEFASVRHEAMEAARKMVQPVWGLSTSLLGLLEPMHHIDPEVTEQIIKEFAVAVELRNYEKGFTDVLARIRSQYNFDSLSGDERAMWAHRAAAEIYGLRVDAHGDDLDRISR